MSLPVQNLSTLEINLDEKCLESHLFLPKFSAELMSPNLLTHYATFGHSEGTKIAFSYEKLHAHRRDMKIF